MTLERIELRCLLVMVVTCTKVARLINNGHKGVKSPRTKGYYMFGASQKMR
jgi:hypothetical protein